MVFPAFHAESTERLQIASSDDKYGTTSCCSCSNTNYQLSYFSDDFSWPGCGKVLQKQSFKLRADADTGLFGPAYDGAKPFSRPKYGVQNIWNDYRGVLGAKQYGDSYVVPCIAIEDCPPFDLHRFSLHVFQEG
eukprot:3503647-Amphidinium_carterae.1